MIIYSLGASTARLFYLNTSDSRCSLLNQPHLQGMTGGMVCVMAQSLRSYLLPLPSHGLAGTHSAALPTWQGGGWHSSDTTNAFKHPALKTSQTPPAAGDPS